ncbi:bifunctional diguanylate cyclase/phosphodiesterase [Pseudoxanthobacter sp.]|uniref:putative bifunctional diguanylate cyclase/phosphodiesterase n=1 Tax=Pseudoxanthobacter sp. TaxID=1925742 RepID=UPI002FDF161F
MALQAAVSQRLGRIFLLTRALPALAGVVLLGLGAMATLWWATAAADRVAVERETAQLSNAVSDLTQGLAHDQESVTIWTEAVQRLQDGSPASRLWLRNNLVEWPQTYFGHDDVILIGPGNAPEADLARYADRPGEPGGYAARAPVLDPMIRQLRSRLAAGAMPRGTGERTAGAEEIVTLAGRPAIVSIRPVVPEPGEAAAATGEPYLLVSVLYLDGPLLEHLRRRHGFADIRYSPTAPPAGGPQSGYPLQAAGERVAGYYIWAPFLPGQAVFHKLAPVLAGIFATVCAVMAAGLVLLFRRTRGEAAARQAADRLALHDDLTGLPNRTLLVQYLRTALAAATPDAPVAVVHINIDRFKLVNETLGPQGGNAILSAFAHRLATCIGPDDLVARIGGDEFTIVAPGRAAEATRALVATILDVGRVPFSVAANPVFVGISAGYFVARGPEPDAEECLRRADVALFHARSASHVHAAEFGDDMDALLRARRETERDLRQALAAGSDQITVFFQPVFAFADGQPCSAEALVRWRHPARGWIAPDAFIPIAEEAGLIAEIGWRVLLAACATAARWPGQSVAVNASPLELTDPGYPGRVAAALTASGLPPERLEIEVTETGMIAASGQSERTLAALRALGIRLAIDDFGTGFSSLSRLRQMDADRIKIDRSFIANLCHNATDRAIVQAIVAMAHAAGLKTTVEGVETAAQCEWLKAAGCDNVQGFFFGRPMPEAEISRLMAAGGAETERTDRVEAD